VTRTQVPPESTQEGRRLISSDPQLLTISLAYDSDDETAHNRRLGAVDQRGQ